MIRVMRCALHTNNALEIKKRLSLQNKRPIHTADDKVYADPHVFSSDQTASFYMLHCTMPEITVIVKCARSQFIHPL